jgi:hypothetical protein
VITGRPGSGRHTSWRLNQPHPISIQAAYFHRDI